MSINTHLLGCISSSCCYSCSVPPIKLLPGTALCRPAAWHSLAARQREAACSGTHHKEGIRLQPVHNACGQGPEAAAAPQVIGKLLGQLCRSHAGQPLWHAWQVALWPGHCSSSISSCGTPWPGWGHCGMMLAHARGGMVRCARACCPAERRRRSKAWDLGVWDGVALTDEQKPVVMLRPQ